MELWQSGLYFLLPFTLGVLSGYLLAKIAWVRNRKLENATDRLDYVLIDMEKVARTTEKSIRDFEKNPYVATERFFGMDRKLEDYSNHKIFKQIEDEYGNLHSKIVKFFGDMDRMHPSFIRARRDIQKGVGETLDVFITQDKIVLDAQYGDEKDLVAEKRNATGTLVSLLYPAVVLNWGPERTLRKMEEEKSAEWRSEFARFSPMEIHRADFVVQLYVFMNRYNGVEEYRKARERILRSHKSLMTDLSKRIDEDSKIAHQERLIGKWTWPRIWKK